MSAELGPEDREPTSRDVEGALYDIGLSFVTRRSGQKQMGPVGKFTADAIGVVLGVGLILGCGYGILRAIAPDAEQTPAPAGTATVTTVGPDHASPTPLTRTTSAPGQRRTPGR